jgi:hypothetical protein
MMVSLLPVTTNLLVLTKALRMVIGCRLPRWRLIQMRTDELGGPFNQLWGVECHRLVGRRPAVAMSDCHIMTQV